MGCKCYHADRNFLGKIGVCWGTRELDPCSCGGDEAKCDYYDHVRETQPVYALRDGWGNEYIVPDRIFQLILPYMETEERDEAAE